MVIYPEASAIQLFNNWGLVSKNHAKRYPQKIFKFIQSFHQLLMVCLERFEKCSILLFQTQDHIMLEHVADLFKSFQLSFDHENQPF